MTESLAPAPLDASAKAALETAILDAHGRHDGAALAELYGEAASRHEALGNTDAACFFYTQAFVFALEAGSPSAEDHAAILRRHRRL
jgi:L-alanine-DL-glutamate epimerase-like enolase superfamily enzyme